MKFKLGQFHPLGDIPVNIAGRMCHGELLTLGYIEENLYSQKS